MRKIKFCITTSGELVILESHTDKERWRGKPQGIPVSKAILLPYANDLIVLLEYAYHPRRPFRNLIRMRPDGSIIWHAELPQATANDAYVDIELTGGSLLAWSWSGYRVVIDPVSGKIIQKTFIK